MFPFRDHHSSPLIINYVASHHGTTLKPYPKRRYAPKKQTVITAHQQLYCITSWHYSPTCEYMGTLVFRSCQDAENGGTPRNPSQAAINDGTPPRKRRNTENAGTPPRKRSLQYESVGTPPRKARMRHVKMHESHKAEILTLPYIPQKRRPFLNLCW